MAFWGREGVKTEERFWEALCEVAVFAAFPKPSKNQEKVCPNGQLIGTENSFFVPERQGPMAGGRTVTELGKTGIPSIFLSHYFSLARESALRQVHV